jgi:uncharacterized protein
MPVTSPTEPVQTQAKTRFYGTVKLNDTSAKMDFSDIVDEIVEHFTTKTGVTVNISIEIEAEHAQGFDEALQRTVKENSNQLSFINAEFEE